MLNYNIVINHTKKEYWVAEPKYNERIEDDVKILKNIYGDKNITFFPTDIKNLEKDLDIEKHRGYVESHYINWI